LPKSSKERKQKYDAAMRNRGRLLRPDDEERFPTILYLSERARHVLRERRSLDRQIGATPCPDSLFAETAILALLRDAPPPMLTEPQRMAKAYRAQILKERLTRDEAETRAYDLELEVQALRRKVDRAKQVEAIPFDSSFLQLHATIRKHILTSRTQLEEAQAVHRALCEFLEDSSGGSAASPA